MWKIIPNLRMNLDKKPDDQNHRMGDIRIPSDVGDVKIILWGTAQTATLDSVWTMVLFNDK